MNKELNQYLEYIKTNYSNWMNQSPSEIRNRMTEEFKSKVRFQEGSKFIKVITGTSVHSFIVKEDSGKFKKGDILKAASWSAPAKNFSRGNILNKEYGMISWTGA